MNNRNPISGACLVFAVLVCSCGPVWYFVHPTEILVRENKAHFPRLDEGMSAAQVNRIMGAKDGVQPSRCEASQDSTGASFDVWYYLLESPFSSRYEYEQTRSPVVLRNDVVLGIGWDFLRHEVGRHFTTVGNRNAGRISRRLRNGMSKEAVLYDMSHAPPNLGSVEDRNYGIPQPYRAVTHRIPDDGLLEILYYLVAYPAGDRERRYLAPIVLKDGILVGRGWDEARDVANRYDIEAAVWMSREVPGTRCPGRNSRREP